LTDNNSEGMVKKIFNSRRNYEYEEDIIFNL